MLRLGLLLAVIGAVVLVTGAGLIVYSQNHNTGADISRKAFQAAEDSEYPPVIARVNGAEISGKTVTFHLAGRAASMEAMPELAEALPAGATSTAREVLDSLIEDELAYQEAERRGLLCSEEEVEELARSQMPLDQPDVLEVWAEYLGTSADEIATHPEILEGYAESCAMSRLRAAITPPDVKGDAAAANRVWDEFRESLREGADIEILEPSLR